MESARDFFGDDRSALAEEKLIEQAMSCYSASLGGGAKKKSPRKKSPKKTSPKRKSPKKKSPTKRHSPSQDKRRMMRPSPSRSAAETRVGTVSTGNDGHQYKVIKTSNDVKRWVKVKA